MNIFQKVTLKTLRENRTRTLVTIIGIILSAAMFTAVTVAFLLCATIWFPIRFIIKEAGTVLHTI